MKNFDKWPVICQNLTFQPFPCNTFPMKTTINWSKFCLSNFMCGTFVTVFWKTDRMVTNTEIHFMPVDECHTHALPRDTMHLRIVGQVCFYRRLFCDAVKPQGCISWPVWPLRGINKTAWGAKLILTAGLVHHSSCASLHYQKCGHRIVCSIRVFKMDFLVIKLSIVAYP